MSELEGEIRKLQELRKSGGINLPSDANDQGDGNRLDILLQHCKFFLLTFFIHVF